MIAGLQTKQGDKFVDATEVKNSDGTITYSFPVVVDEVKSAKIHVVVPSANMDKWYEFDLKAVKEDVKEEVKEEVKVNEVAVTVYKMVQQKNRS